LKAGNKAASRRAVSLYRPKFLDCPAGAVPNSYPLLDLLWDNVIAAPNGWLRIIESHHEQAQCAWDYGWSRVIKCGALLASMVAKECGALP
jgi:hypothetical protein